MKPVRVIIVDDQPFVRSGIRLLLEKSPDIQVIGEACNGIEALALVEELSPDVLLLDFQMPVMDGLQVAEILRSSNSPVRTIVVSGYDDFCIARELLNCGVKGYILKEDVPQLLVKFVRDVFTGRKSCVSPRIAQKIFA